MATSFKPLEEIATDSRIEVGDLLFLKDGSEVVPVFYGGLDVYVSDGSAAGHEKGEKFRGVRVFHKLDSKGGPRVEGHKSSVFRDYNRGLLILFLKLLSPNTH